MEEAYADFISNGGTKMKYDWLIEKHRKKGKDMPTIILYDMVLSMDYIMKDGRVLSLVKEVDDDL